jgi:uncharacterized protein
MTRQPRTRTTVRRLPAKQVLDRGALDAVLDACLVVHVAVADDTGQPFVLPLGFARDRDRLLVHGSTASRTFRLLAAGAPSCATVTIVDGVVVARSEFESSYRYRSAMVLGSFEALHGTAKREALERLSAHLLPGIEGRRPPSDQELAATAVLALPLDEWSVKIADGDPDDNPEDLDRPVWAGVVPLQHVWGDPIDAPDLLPGHTPPAAVRSWRGGRA